MIGPAMVFLLSGAGGVMGRGAKPPGEGMRFLALQSGQPHRQFVALFNCVYGGWFRFTVDGKLFPGQVPDQKVK